MKALILAAGRGSRMGALTDSKPKCLVELHNKPLLLYQIEALRAAHISEIGIVVGYQSQAIAPFIESYNLKVFENAQWADSNMVHSLSCAKEWLLDSVSIAGGTSSHMSISQRSTQENAENLREGCIVSYSDIFYSAQGVKDLMRAKSDMAILYSSKWRHLWEKRFINPLEDAESFKMRDNILCEIGSRAQSIDEIQGQYMGLLYFSKKGLERFLSLENSMKIDTTSLLRRCIANGEKILCVKYAGVWGECDSASDIALYEGLYPHFTHLT